MKKLVSLLLSVALVLTAFTIGAFAEEDYSKQAPYTVKIVADGYCSSEACEEVAASFRPT